MWTPNKLTLKRDHVIPELGVICEVPLVPPSYFMMRTLKEDQRQSARCYYGPHLLPASSISRFWDPA